MGLRVVGSNGTIAGANKVSVVVESDIGKTNFPQAFEELQSGAARVAVDYAKANGMPTAAVNGAPSAPYPVNSEDIALTKVDEDLTAANKPLAPDDPRRVAAKYRVDVPLVSRPL